MINIQINTDYTIYFIYTNCQYIVNLVNNTFIYISTITSLYNFTNTDFTIIDSSYSFSNTFAYQKNINKLYRWG